MSVATVFMPAVYSRECTPIQRRSTATSGVLPLTVRHIELPKASFTGDAPPGRIRR
jgi:hypothetical protein